MRRRYYPHTKARRCAECRRADVADGSHNYDTYALCPVHARWYWGSNPDLMKALVQETTGGGNHE